jgi:hypothetical protein
MVLFRRQPNKLTKIGVMKVEFLLFQSRGLLLQGTLELKFIGCQHGCEKELDVQGSSKTTFSGKNETVSTVLCLRLALRDSAQ